MMPKKIWLVIAHTLNNMQFSHSHRGSTHLILLTTCGATAVCGELWHFDSVPEAVQARSGEHFLEAGSIHTLPALPFGLALQTHATVGPNKVQSFLMF